MLKNEPEEITKAPTTGFFNFFQSGRQHPKYPHVIVQLMGRFKMETGERCHLKPLAYKTSSRIAAGMWMERFIECWIMMGKPRQS